MDNRVFNKWLREKKIIEADLKGHTRALFCGNCSDHVLKLNITTSLANIKTKLRELQPNVTHFVLLLNSRIVHL